MGYLASGADCSQPAAPDIAAVVARLRDAAARAPEGSWVTGSGYVEYKLREGRHPTRADLAAAVPGQPAILFHTSLHACVLNTPALREAGFDDRQPDPPGGRFGRDREGRLDGVVYEGPTFTLLWGGLRRDMERMSAAARAGLVARAGQHFSALGITAACDADTRRDSLTAYAEADERGMLGVRVAGLVVTCWLSGTRSPCTPQKPRSPCTENRTSGPGAGQARRLSGPGPQPAEHAARADHGHPGPGHGRWRAARLPGR